MLKKLTLLGLSLLIASFSFGASAVPLCNAEVCPLNQHALVWENDRFGAYLYGPGNYHCWNGVDVFNKSIPGSAAVAWSRDPALNRHDVHPNIHDNRGEGMDSYTMGAARGVGGVALWADGEWKTYVSWESAEILHTGDDYLEFKLVYPAFSNLGRMTYHITLKKGDDFFRNDVTFERPERFGRDWRVGPGIDLDPSRGHHGDLVEEPGLVSLHEKPQDALGEFRKFSPRGASMSAVFAAPGSDVEMKTDPLNCRVIGFKKAKFTYYAGASWSVAGHFPDAAAWHRKVISTRNAIK